MVDIHHQGTCDAPLDVTFAYIDELANVPKWMFGVSSFAPVAGRPDKGIGAVYQATFSVKPVKLKTTVEIAEYAENDVVKFRSIEGFTNSSTWRFTALGDEQTRIDVVFSYELPGGIAGKALGRAFEPVVALTVRESDRQLRKHVAEHYAATGKG